MIFIGTDDGKVQVTENGGQTWTDLTNNIAGFPKGGWVPQIRTSSYNANEVFVVANNYRQGDFAPYIFRSTDLGKTWTRMVDDKKVNGYALTVLQDPVEPNLVFVGTEQGFYVSLDNGVSYQQWKNGYPSVSTYDFAIQERESDLAIATFGRSLWVLDDIKPLRKLAATKGTVNKFFVSAPNASYNFSIKNSPYEWSTWGMWDAPNKPVGLPITIYSTDSTKKAKVQIKDSKDAVIRNLTFKIDTGFNRNYWGFEQKGKRAAGAPKTGGGGRRMMDEESAAASASDDDKEFTGRDILAGKYKIIVSAGNQKDSVWVEVKDDPRLANKNEIVLAQDAAMEKLQPANDKYNAALDLIDDAELVLAGLKVEWKDKKDKGVDTLNKAHKIVAEKLKDLRAYMMGKKQEKQGYGTVPVITPLGVIRNASSLIGGKNSVPAEQEQAAIQDAIIAANEIAAKVNAFIEKDWADFRKLVEANPIKKFKEVELIK